LDGKNPYNSIIYINLSENKIVMSLIIMVMGLPGSGKSFFSRRLADTLGASYIGSDELRNKMGLMGNYQMSFKHRVYQEMIRAAEAVIKNNGEVVLDATFFLKETRNKVEELCHRYGTKLIPILVEAEENIIGERLSKPRRDSEADFQVYRQIKESFEPLSGSYLSLLSTNDNIEELIGKAIHYIENQHGKK
jgi:predicted kinase